MKAAHPGADADAITLRYRVQCRHCQALDVDGPKIEDIYCDREADVNEIEVEQMPKLSHHKIIPPAPQPAMSPFARKLARAFQDIRDGSYTAHELNLPDPRYYDAKAVRSLRNRMRLTQRAFARLIGASVELVEHWEQGVTTPRPIARRLLDQINRDPESFINSLAELATAAETIQATNATSAPRKKRPTRNARTSAALRKLVARDVV